MTENEDATELLFFDTFSHEVDADINLDLVQFPKPVYITQVRIIPLGARVQADFPGGVRLGATNPSKFEIEFFVNDLGMPGASTFENLGHLQYNQNDCIHLECTHEKIPTDGLVLRGWYSTITLAVYGILTNSLNNEHIASPPPPICEPEEMCNISADGRTTAVLQEENIKEEWKEPLTTVTGELHKAVVSDYEREDLEYEVPARDRDRDHYHHSGDERERRNRKASHSSERSASSRHRTLSESNEREFVRSREKTTRDWSRSPDYTRHSRRKRSERSRSDADEPHKWPRTPPASIDSPTRPRSPDTVEYNDEEAAYAKLKAHPYMHSNDSLAAVAVPVAPTTEVHALTEEDDDGTPGTPGEQFEPILSDDEIIGDDEDDVVGGIDDDSNATAEPIAADDCELDVAAAEPAIQAFDPFKTPLSRYAADLHSHYSKELENLQVLFKKFSLQTKCDSVAAFSDPAASVDERESFVYLGEQLINQLGYLAHQLQRRNFVLQQFFGGDQAHLRQACGILQVALDFEAACLQTQPAFKIRHIKVGARLAELLGSSPEFVAHLLAQQYEPFKALLQLYQQDYMALSIKLMLLKAIYALLDTAVGLRHFLGGKLNGYQLLLEMLQQSHLTRTKYALQAIIKKLHLHEALALIRENCTQLFVLVNHCSTEPYQLTEHAIDQLLEALARNALSYQQPRRFLPVSKKYEIVADAVAQRSFANALQTYLAQHSLAESLLLLFANASELPHALLMRCIELLATLLATPIGLDYFVDDCFETTQMLVATLLAVDELPAPEPQQSAEQSPEVTFKLPKCEGLKQELHEVSPALPPVAELKSVVATPAEDDEKAAAEKLAAAQCEPMHSPATPLLGETADEIGNLQVAVKGGHVPPLQRLQLLGMELAYKVQTRYHLDAVAYMGASIDYDSVKLATHLHALYSQTCHPTGRRHTVEVIGLNNNLAIFMDLIKKEQRLQAQRQLASPGAKYKSPVLSYAVDIVDCCVRYCENLDYLIEHGAHILELAKNHETFEPSVSAVLQEMFVYLKPLEVINIFAYDDITPLVEVITRSLEYITTFPGDLIMGLRILRHLAIGSPSTAFSSADTEQLKHRFVALQFYAADGVQMLMQILERLCTYFEQPGLHTPALMTMQGLHCCQIVLPTLQVLREMLSFAIQCRDVEYKDLTAIDHLMRAYSLMHYFPTGSQATTEVQLAQKEIVQTLLAYTQPNEQDEESLHKSLWTQIIREILKNIDGPSSFMPGLRLLTELLPLPLPMPLPSTMQQFDAQKHRLTTERKLWSAHLHPQSAQIAKLIETIAPTSFPPLADLMVRVCWQLADLAPNMTLLISKTVTDLLCAEWTANSGIPNQSLARLLHFFARLSAHASLKSSALSILSGKLWELLAAILNLTESTGTATATSTTSPTATTTPTPTTTALPVTTPASATTLKCQVAIHRILESFLDSEISLISPQSTSTPELNLASALPPKELIPRIVEAVLLNLFNTDVTHEVSALCVRNLVILTEHDITFYHLAMQLKQKAADFQLWLQKILQHNETGSYSSNIESLILLLRSLTQVGEEQESAQRDSTIPRRSLKLTADELSPIIGFRQTDTPNVVQRIRSILVDHPSGKAVGGGALLGDLDLLIAQLEATDATGAAMDTDEDSASRCSPCEPILPQTESIVTQYAARPIFTLYATTPSGIHGDGAALSADFWLEPATMEACLAGDDADAQYERIPCDLTELARACLTCDTNLTTDCKRLLHLSASPQSNRERTPTGAPCFRTRRVEVEPSTGRPEKKIYITPVRGRGGFARAPPTRGDLFRSRPPNTSRPPSLHVDDFLALETCGAQPTGPTGYNKIPPIMRGGRVGRNRGSRISAAAAYRKSKAMRTSSPSPWNDGSSPHYRSPGGDSHYSSSPHFSSRPRARGSHIRSYMR